MSVEITNESGADVDEDELLRLARYVLDAQGVPTLAELSVLLVDADAMTALHERWMGLPGPTDVLAFPMDDEPEAGRRGRVDPSAPPPTEQGAVPMLGDVVLCPDVARTQAEAAGHSLRSELALLCTHGILHVLGYDHGEPDDEREMFELQRGLLTQWSAHIGGEPIHVPVAGTQGEQRTSTS